MLTLTRRTAVMATPAVLLAGCTGTAPTLSQLAQYAQAASAAAQDVMAQIPSGSVPANLAAIVTDINNAAKAIVASGVGTTTTSFAQTIYDGIKTVLPIAAPLLGAIPGLGLALSALQAIMPFIASLAGLVAAPMVRTKAMAAIPQMTAAQALKLYGPK
jgi:hypothetical protein